MLKKKEALLLQCDVKVFECFSSAYPPGINSQSLKLEEKQLNLDCNVLHSKRHESFNKNWCC